MENVFTKIGMLFSTMLIFYIIYKINYYISSKDEEKKCYKIDDDDDE